MDDGEGTVMTTDICDLATSARAIGKGELVSEKSHKVQVDSSLAGLGGPTKSCPKSVARCISSLDLWRTPYRRSSEKAPSTHSGE
jgi:hypothetical protein